SISRAIDGDRGRIKKMSRVVVVAAWAGALFCLASPGLGAEASWPQFRGLNGTAQATEGRPLPTEIAPDRNVAWKIEAPAGHSSPIIYGDRIYLTAVREGKLLTLALNRQTGGTLSAAPAPHDS